MHITPRKTLFTPNGAKEYLIKPDNISREHTTEIIDISKGGNLEILENNWQLISQILGCQKDMIASSKR